MRQSFLKVCLSAGSAREKQYATENTLFLIAQYLGWTEIVRQELRFIALQVGELMIVPNVAPPRVLGYGAFLISRPPELEQWLAPLRDNLVALASDHHPREPRLTEIQRTLVSVLELLDKDAVYFPQDKRTHL